MSGAAFRLVHAGDSVVIVELENRIDETVNAAGWASSAAAKTTANGAIRIDMFTPSWKTTATRPDCTVSIISTRARRRR